MKQSTFLSAALATAAAVTVASLVLFTSAQAAPGNGAIVTRADNACFIFVVPFGSIVADLQDVQTPSGNEKYTCNGQLSPGTEPSRAVVIKDVSCGGNTGFGTGDIRITPSGNVNVTCQIRP